MSLVGPGGLLAGITKTVLQAALEAEMSEHLGYDKGERPQAPTGNHRNGTSSKTVLPEVGPVGIEVPRDRAGNFEPQIVPKHTRRIREPQRPVPPGGPPARSFPHRTGRTQTLYLVIRSSHKNRADVTGKTPRCKTALNALSLYYGDRIILN